LVSKFFENKILRDPFSKIRPQQGFRRHRNKKKSHQIRPESQNALMAKWLSKLYFAAEIHNRNRQFNQPRPGGRLIVN
jgi:hypothetical protein